jgi:3-hydroxy-3-methylglutaryl CoA synthase
MPTYIVKIKGEYEVTQAVTANTEEEAKDKAKQGLGETIDSIPSGDPDVVSIKVM